MISEPRHFDFVSNQSGGTRSENVPGSADGAGRVRTVEKQKRNKYSIKTRKRKYILTGSSPKQLGEIRPGTPAPNLSGPIRSDVGRESKYMNLFLFVSVLIHTHVHTCMKSASGMFFCPPVKLSENRV